MSLTMRGEHETRSDNVSWEHSTVGIAKPDALVSSGVMVSC